MHTDDSVLHTYTEEMSPPYVAMQYATRSRLYLSDRLIFDSSRRVSISERTTSFRNAVVSGTREGNLRV
jgi:hypothetical protein